jgi:FkbM family methyltransferase
MPPRVPTRLRRAGGRVLRAAGLRRSAGARPGRKLYQVIFEFARANPRASFVQVGSNDGEGEDPLRLGVVDRQWSGIMIEPVPYIFERLQRNYASNPRLRFENAAVADHDGVQEMFFLEQAKEGDAVPDWYDKLGSFRKDVILKHAADIPDIEQRLTTLEVPCLTFDTLCRKHQVTRVDLIQIDTEGYDFEIIKLIDLARLRPKIVMFENFHMDPATHDACRAHMRSHGYEHLSDGMDTVCLRPGGWRPRDRRLDRFWRTMTTGYVPDSWGPAYPEPEGRART